MMSWQRLLLPLVVLVLAAVVLLASRHGLLGAGSPAGPLVPDTAGAVVIAVAAECDVRPEPVSGFRPDAMSGVRARVLISPEGDALEALLLSGSGDARSDSLALLMLKGTTFSRPTRRGTPVMCLLDVGSSQ